MRNNQIKMTSERFEQLIKEALDAIPEEFQIKIKNIAIVIENEVSREKRRELNLKKNETLFGLYEGIPQTERGTNYSLVLPDKITIFKQPILEQAKTEEKIRQEIIKTVWHELAHHFGHNEAQTRRKEKRKFKL